MHANQPGQTNREFVIIIDNYCHTNRMQNLGGLVPPPPAVREFSRGYPMGQLPDKNCGGGGQLKMGTNQPKGKRVEERKKRNRKQTSWISLILPAGKCCWKQQFRMFSKNQTKQQKVSWSSNLESSTKTDLEDTGSMNLQVSERNKRFLQLQSK